MRITDEVLWRTYAFTFIVWMVQWKHAGEFTGNLVRT